MTFIADLHIHSHFSRATSRTLDPEHLALWAGKKGIAVIGTGDFTHPGWVRELQEKLVEAENGLFRLAPSLEDAVEKELPPSCKGPARFVLSGEISCIYKRHGKTRKVHQLIILPDFPSVVLLQERLDRIGNITSDGRPILGLDSRDLLETVLEVSDRAFFIPAHIWTPWFSLFGSKSGFDAIEECFDDLTPHIHALETGLSSDPPMNRLLSGLDQYLLVSNSDAHSPGKLGREANIFDTGLDYDEMLHAMVNGQGFAGTIEFYPEEGKYHLDGHRKCDIRFEPGQTRAHDGICPSCGKPLTVGVLHRVHELADRKQPRLSKDFHSLIPLQEILSEMLDCGPSTKKVTAAYEDLLAALGPELSILMHAPIDDIEQRGGPLLARAIDRMRKDQVIRLGGYDGEYGVIKLFHEDEKSALLGQTTLFKTPGIKTPAFKTPGKKGGPGRRPSGPKGPGNRKVQQHGGAVREEASDPILDPLNPEQREAVMYRGGHLLIVAGPGTGKTRTLTHRIAHLLRSEGIPPDQVLALTFTNKAAGEMKERLTPLTAGTSSGKVWVGTFHAFCLEVLRAHGDRVNLPLPFGLCSEMDVPVLAGQVIADAGKGARALSRFLKNLSALKAASVTGQGHANPSEELLFFFRKYQEILRNQGLLDLDDLEVETLRLFQDHPEVCVSYSRGFPWIFVDEYQDTNPIQAQILKALVYASDPSGPTETDDSPPYAVRRAPCAVSICAIGDPNQSIYGFRGADLQNFYRFEEDFPGTKRMILNRNYRSTQTILDGSGAVMDRHDVFLASAGPGTAICIAACRTQAEEAEMAVEHIEKLVGGTTYFSLDSGRVASHEAGEDIGFGDIAILYRLNAQGDGFEEALSRAGIPYVRSGESPLISRYPVNILWRFLQTLQNPSSPFYREVYLDLMDHDARRVERILGQFNPEDSLPDLIEKAVKHHGLDAVSGDEDEALRRLSRIAKGFDGDLASFLDILSLERGIDHATLAGDRVALMSLHAAKGLEWPVVFIGGCEDGLIPCSLFGDRDDAEEKRLLYVGMTRAGRILILSHAGRRTLNGRVLQLPPSPFLDLIPGNLCRPLERSSWKRKKRSHTQLDLF